MGFVAMLTARGRAHEFKRIRSAQSPKSPRMIRFLSVENLAVVDRLEVEFPPGFTVLTGETGAGKSVVVGALDLLFGGRASSDLIRTGHTKARVQASVEDAQGEEIVLRREISSQGRSRVFIDDVLATVGALRQRATQLIDLHGQHDHQALLNASSHLALLDAYGTIHGHLDDGAELAEAFRAWRKVHHRLTATRTQEKDTFERRERLASERDEIDLVAPEPDEDTRLAERRARLTHAERLRTVTSHVYAELYESDDAIIPRLGDVWRGLDELAEIDASFEPYRTFRGEVESRLEDVAFFLRSYSSQLEDSQDDLESVENRLHDLDRLKRRYGPDLEDVLGHLSATKEELDDIGARSESIEALEKEEAQARKAYIRAAKLRTEKRRRASAALSDELKKILRTVAIPRASFDVRFGDAGDEPDSSAWTSTGVDSVEFYFSANPGEVERPLTAVASGGELSRVMLGLKTLATTDHVGKTLVFDEIDAGIGGVVADRVGAMLSQLAERYQVICVTHLAQIAAYATTHFVVTKQVRDGRTTVGVTRLDEHPERVTEVARLMAGRDSPAAKAGAAELIESKQTPKDEGKRRKRKSQLAKGER